MVLARQQDTIFQADTGIAYAGVRVQAYVGLVEQQLYSDSAGTPTALVETNTNGLYEFWIEEGDYTLQFSVDGTSIGSGDYTIINYARAGASFIARPSLDQSIAAAASTKVNFGTQDSDPNGWYDPTLSRFQPTIAGRYRLDVRLWCTLAAAGGNVSLTLTPSGAMPSFCTFQDTLATGNYSLPAEGIFNMNGTTDYVDVRVIHSNAGNLIVKQGTNQTYFIGSRLA